MAVKTKGKWHIGANGVPSLCKAEKRPCPYGATGHFETQAEAAQLSQQLLEKQFGVHEDKYGDNVDEVEHRKLKSMTYKQATYSENGQQVDTMVNLILDDFNMSKRNRAGIAAETFGACAYAEDMGLTNTCVFANKVKVYSNLDDKTSIDKAEYAREKAINLIKTKLESQKITLKNENELINVLHYSDDGETAVVQMGGSNVLDIAVIQNNSVEFVEYKTIDKTGSQLSAKTMQVDENGKAMGIDCLPENVKKSIEKIGFKNTFGTNVALNLTHRESLEFFVNSYKEKGADKLAYHKSDGKVSEIDFSQDTESIVRKLENDNIVATLRLRSNQTDSVPTDVDKKRWKEKRNHYFKNGKIPKDDDTFTLNDLNPEYFKYDNPSVKRNFAVGEMVLPIKKSEIKTFDRNKPIKMSSIKVRALQLIGDIKEKNSNTATFLDF